MPLVLQSAPVRRAKNRAFDALPHITAVALPQSDVDVTYSLPTGTTYYVSSTGFRNNGSTAADYTSLTSAITAVPRNSVIRIKNGDVQTISTDQGWPLPFKSGSGWIYIMPEDDSLIPAVGTRIVSGAYTDTPNVTMANLPVIAFTSVGGSMSRLITEDGDLNYRFIGIHFRRATGMTDPNYGFFVGSATSAYVTIDRCVAGDTTALTANRGIVPCNYFALVESEVDVRSSSSDNQCVWSGRPVGPVLIQNNTLRNASEVIMTGGGTWGAAGDYTPHDWTIRRNWMQWTPDLYTGRAGLNCKNLFEIKDGTRFLIEKNVFEGYFCDDQDNCIVLKPTNQDQSADTPNCSDITLRWNIVYNCEANIYYVAGQNNGVGGDVESLRRIAVYQNAFLDMGDKSDFGAGRGVSLISNLSPAGVAGDWQIIDAYFVHNTVIGEYNAADSPGGDSFAVGALVHDPGMDFIALNNVFSKVKYPILTFDASSVATAFAASTCIQNAIVGLGTTAVWTAGNSFGSPTADSDVFTNYAGGDYSVTAAYQGIADASLVDLQFPDLGCDLASLAGYVSGVRTAGNIL